MRIIIITGRSAAPSFLKACFSCGEDPSQLPEGNFVVFFLLISHVTRTLQILWWVVGMIISSS